MNTLATGKTKAKQTPRGLRIWLEGGKLTKAGFVRGLKYSKDTSEQGSLKLTIDPTGPLVVAGRTRKDKELPIIDIVSKDLGFAPNSPLAVEYRKDLIIIKAA